MKKGLLFLTLLAGLFMASGAQASILSNLYEGGKKIVNKTIAKGQEMVKNYGNNLVEDKNKTVGLSIMGAAAICGSIYFANQYVPSIVLSGINAAQFAASEVPNLREKCLCTVLLGTLGSVIIHSALTK